MAYHDQTTPTVDVAPPLRAVPSPIGTVRAAAVPDNLTAWRNLGGKNVVQSSKIMIVDDEPTTIRTVRRHLEDFGYPSFVEVSDSRCCVEIIRQESPDIVLLDILMPHVDGFSILQTVRDDEQTRHIPVVVLTAYSDVQTKVRALKLGATDILAKPVDPSELVLRVLNVLKVRAFHERLANQAEELERQVSLRTEELASSRKVASQGYRAGKAEIATEVLHNVGNALNSVNVSVALIRRSVQRSRITCVTKALQLLLDHLNDLPAFLNDDEKGKLFPSYLSALAASLTDDHHTLLAEIESLNKHVGHIRNIIETQQEYADISGVHEPVSLPALMADAEALSGVGLVHQDIDIVRDYADLPKLMLDKQKLIQVWVNLLKNAGHALKERSEGDRQLTLRIRTLDTDCVQIEVSDNGAGIAPDDLPRIFSYGFTTKAKGRGLGLHSCANAVKELKGSLTADSDGPGQGARFTMKLPFQPVETES